MEAAVYEELDEVKAQFEQVREEIRQKMVLHQELKRAYDDRMTELQDAKLQIRKLSEEVCVKSTVVSEVQRVCEELNKSVAEKDLIFRQLKSANEKVRAGLEEKVMYLEGSNRELVMRLDDVMEKKKVLEDKIRARNEENEGLKASMLATESKCLEMKKNVSMSKELSSRDEMIARLEEEVRNVQDRLKWRNEQFDHLEEAHDKLNGEFRLSKSEWEKERRELIDQISCLQSSLDSQTRISNSLQTELTICNQALAREESRSKLFQAQLTESIALCMNINGKCQEEQVIDRLTNQKDEEIANMRGQMAKKDIMLKEMDFKILELEHQKEDMHVSLKEFQEAGIKHAGNINSMTKLQKKLKKLEVMHHNVSVSIKNKEAEWESQSERLKAKAKEHLSEIEKKEAQVSQLHKDLEMCQLSLQILNEEMQVVILVLKSEYSEAYSKLHREYEIKKHEEYESLESKVTHLTEQHQSLLLKNDLEIHENMIEESQRKQRQLEEHIFVIDQSSYKAELEMSQFSLMLLNEEMSVVMMLLKSEYSEAYSKLVNEYENKKYKDSSVPVLDSNVTDLVEQQQIHLMARDLECELYKNMVKESNRKKSQLEENIFEAKQAYEAELVEKTNERDLKSAELLEWKNETETLKLLLEQAQQANLDLQLENQETFEQEIDNLKNAVNEHERNISVLQQHVTSLEEVMEVKDDTLKLLESKNIHNDGAIKELDFKNMLLNENLSRLVTQRNNILTEMERASNQLQEICCQDGILMESLGNTEYQLGDGISNASCCNKTSVKH